MKTLALFWVCTFLTACATSPKPTVLTEVQTVKLRVPKVLATACDRPWHKGPGPAGGAETVEDLYARGDVNEQRLLACGAKISGVISWDKSK